MLYLNYSQLRQKGKEIFTNVNAIKASIANNLLMHGWSQQKSLSSRTMIIKRGKFWDIIKLKHGRSVGEDLIMYLNNWSKKHRNSGRLRSSSPFDEAGATLWWISSNLWLLYCLFLRPSVRMVIYFFARVYREKGWHTNKRSSSRQTCIYRHTHTERRDNIHFALGFMAVVDGWNYFTQGKGNLLLRAPALAVKKIWADLVRRRCCLLGLDMSGSISFFFPSFVSIRNINRCWKRPTSRHKHLLMKIKTAIAWTSDR